MGHGSMGQLIWMGHVMGHEPSYRSPAPRWTSRETMSHGLTLTLTLILLSVWHTKIDSTDGKVLAQTN